MLKLVPVEVRAKLRHAPLTQAALIIEFGILAALMAALCYQASVGAGDPPARIARVFSALNSHGAIGLGFFAAVAFGYGYWMLDLLHEVTAKLAWARRMREVLFALTVITTLAGLALWNIALLQVA